MSTPPPPWFSLSLSFRRPAARGEVTSIAISRDNLVCASYANATSWIDIFALTSTPTTSSIAKPQVEHALPCPTGRIYATLKESQLVLKQIGSGKPHFEVRATVSIPFCWSTDGQWIAAAEGKPGVPDSEGMRMGVWETTCRETKHVKRVGRVISHIDRITHVEFLPNGHVVTLSRDRTLRITNFHTHKTVRKLELPAGGMPRGLYVSADGETIICIWGTEVQIWCPSEGDLASYPLNNQREAWPLCVSADGQYMACRTEVGFDVTELRSGEVVAEQRYQGIVSAGAFSSDGKTLLLGTMDGSVDVWNIGSVC